MGTKSDTDEVLGLFSILFGVLTFLFKPFYVYLTKRKVIFTVKDKGILTSGAVVNGNGVTKTNFMVYTTENKSYKNVNTIWYWKWRSTELQSQIDKGKKYTATVYGWRIGMFDVYPNIIDVHEMKKTKKK
jgi:hypothetical protein